MESRAHSTYTTYIHTYTLVLQQLCHWVGSKKAFFRFQTGHVLILGVRLPRAYDYRVATLFLRNTTVEDYLGGGY